MKTLLWQKMKKSLSHLLTLLPLSSELGNCGRAVNDDVEVVARLALITYIVYKCIKYVHISYYECIWYIIYRYHIMNISPASRRPPRAQTRSLPRRRQLLSVPICPGFLGVIGMIIWFIMRRRRMVRMILYLGIQSLSDSVRAQTRKVGSKWRNGVGIENYVAFLS